MPKVIAGCGEWRPVQITGDLVGDENLVFLSTVEECLPIEVDGSGGASRPKGKRTRKRKAEKKDGLLADPRELPRKKKRPKKERKDEVHASPEHPEECQNSKEIWETAQDGCVYAPNAFHALKYNGPWRGELAEAGANAARTQWTALDISDEVLQAVADMGFTEPTEIQRLVIPSAVRDRLDIIGCAETVNFDSPNQQKFNDLSFRALSEIDLISLDARKRFTEPTEIQRLVIPSAVRDRLDIIGCAETGSGKTLAFAVPIIEYLLAAKRSSMDGNEQQRTIRALILAPTRELVVQIKKHIHALLKYTPFKVASIVGGLSLQKQERILKYVPEIVVATPGRLLALMSSAESIKCLSSCFGYLKVASIVGGLSLQKQERILKYVPEIVVATPGRLLALMSSAESIKCLSSWSELQCLVVDETDRMIEKGHFEDLQQILAAIRKTTSQKLQTFVFSATLTYIHPATKKKHRERSTNMTVEEKIRRLIEVTGIRRGKNKVIDISGERGTAETIVESRINCKNLLEKDTALVYLLKRYSGRTLVFTNSVDASRRLHGILTQVPFLISTQSIT
ncbi:unnamed protein product [Gongylonema pulchrum]|uniref:ATP-dependent RNA helicase n=1 Tax=Gongylonema pulchrum TaxID=637853 RepID=A0A183EAH8_9BILA|nr:unnamed protein product [Gongylonema pulchrum]